MAGKTITGRADKSGSWLACKGLGDRSANGLTGSNRLESLEPRTMKFVHQIGFLEATLGSLRGLLGLEETSESAQPGGC